MNKGFNKTLTIKYFAICLNIAIILFMNGCSVSTKIGDSLSPIEESAAQSETVDAIDDLDETIEEFVEDIILDELLEESEDDLVPSYTQDDLIDFDIDTAFDYCDSLTCNIVKKQNEAGADDDDATENDNQFEIELGLGFDKGIPKSDDDMIYMFELEGYEADGSTELKKPVAEAPKDWEVSIRVPYSDKKLFSRFFPALKCGGQFIPLAYGQYITNPEVIAANSDEYPDIKSKKGLLLDANTLGTDRLSDLNVKRIVYNIPLSFVIGETDSPVYPTIEYEYNGHVYHFNGYLCAGFDSLFSTLTDQGYHCTAIILNDWNEECTDIIHPLSRHKTRKSLYYAFNTEEEAGVNQLEAVAKFLAERYSGGEYGMVYDWVIANEINQQTIWNYMDTDNIFYYTDSFERSFRVFYNAIKSNYSNAKVYYSIDHDWNDNNGYNKGFFNGKDLVSTFNHIATMRGNYDWGLSIHPYPQPLTKVKFWRGDFDKSEDAPIITPMNLSALTDFLKKEENLNPDGKVREIAVTELGFSSKPGEMLQGAAFAYCYKIIEENEYINSFLLNRQTDDKESLQSGLALGLYNNDYSKKYIVDVFEKIDSDDCEEYINEMLNVVGIDSLEEALELAR